MTKARTLADMISDGVIGTTELADDVITPVKLDETGSYVVSTMTANGGSGAVTLAANSDIRATTGNWTGEHSGKIQYHNNEWYFQFADKMIGRNGSAVNVFTVDNTGKGYFADDVGIGTTTANEKLSVSGNIELYNDEQDGYIWFHDAGTRSWTIGSQRSSGNFVLTNTVNIGSNEVFVVSSSGNVGIKNTNPNHPLEIADGHLWVRQDSGNSNGRGIQFGLVGNHGSYRSAIRGGPENYGGTDSGILTFHTQDGYAVSDTPPERMRITSTGNIGIGTGGAPSTNNGVVSRLVEMQGTNNVCIAGTTDTAGMNGLLLEARLSGRSPQPRYAQIGLSSDASGNGSIGFYTAASLGYVLESMKIDDNGRVTKPRQPLCAFKSSIGTTNDQRFGVTNTILNQGGHLDTGSSSGRFTCPVAGNYKCTFTGYTNYTSGYGYVHLRKNGVTQAHAIHWNHNGNTIHTSVANTFIVNCAAGNYLEFWLMSANSRVQDANITFELIG